MTQSDADQSAEMIIHLARLAQSGGGSWGLTPAQWTALRFFHRANRFSRTPSAFSEFHATTRGTASQTVRSLEALGLLERHRSERDGRSIRYDPTEAGRAALREDPLGTLTAALDDLPAGTRAQLRRTLGAVVTRVADSRAAPHFGSCDDCAYLDCTSESGAAFCRCIAATLNGDELDALCADFAPRAAAGA